MVINNDEIGIKYEIKKLEKNTFLLIPVDIETGYAVSDLFYGKESYPILATKESLTGEFVIDNILTLDELKEKMTYYEDDIDFIRDYYLVTEKDNIILVNTSDNKISKKIIDVKEVLDSATKEIYEKIKNNIVVTFNQDSLDNLINIEDIELLRKELYNLRRKLQEFEKVSNEKDINKIVIEKGHVKEVETQKKIDKNMPKSDSKREFSLNNDISLKGLENYIKERVLGHDKIIRYIAKTIIMNYTATDTDEVEPILLVGPTGTGKTQTMQVAASYLNIPFAAVNMVNLVPQGIKGTSLEDCLYSLLVSANYKKEIAERGIFFGDEMDKLGKANVDYKEPIKDIFLNFFDGVPFLLDKKEDDYFFNTKFLNKVFAGRFEDVFEIPQKTIGFDADTKIEKDDFGEMIYDKEYYGKELITRITHIYLYKELNNETRKRILLESKLSRYLNKKIRYERQFGVTLEAQDSYIEAVLEKLDKSKLSMRQLNNLISHTLDEVEYVLLSGNNKGKKLILTKDIVEDNSKFTLI